MNIYQYLSRLFFMSGLVVQFSLNGANTRQTQSLFRDSECKIQSAYNRDLECELKRAGVPQLKKEQELFQALYEKTPLLGELIVLILGYCGKSFEGKLVKQFHFTGRDVRPLAVLADGKTLILGGFGFTAMNFFDLDSQQYRQDLILKGGGNPIVLSTGQLVIPHRDGWNMHAPKSLDMHDPETGLFIEESAKTSGLPETRLSDDRIVLHDNATHALHIVEPKLVKERRNKAEEEKRRMLATLLYEKVLTGLPKELTNLIVQYDGSYDQNYTFKLPLNVVFGGNPVVGQIDQGRLAVSGGDETIAIVDLETKQEVAKYKFEDDLKVCFLSQLPSGNILVCGKCSKSKIRVYVFNESLKQLLKSKDFDFSYDFIVHPCGYIIMGYHNGNVSHLCIWDVEEQRMVKDLVINGFKLDYLLALPNGRIAFVGNNDILVYE